MRVEGLVRPPDARLKQFRIRKNPDTAKFSVTLKYIPLPHALSFDPNQLEDSVIAKHALAGKTEESPTAQECLEVTSTLLNNKLTLNVTLTPRTLPARIYLYEVTLRPKIDGYQMPVWCSDWDMGSGRDGSKTLNLGNFVRDLSQVTAQVYQPKIAKFYCYIEKK